MVKGAVGDASVIGVRENMMSVSGQERGLRTKLKEGDGARGEGVSSEPQDGEE